MEIRIYYEDTDCGGVVYYANYLKYFERARTHYLEERRLSVADLRDQGTQFVVVHAELDYRSPGRYGDTLVIDTTLADSRTWYGSGPAGDSWLKDRPSW
jgi:acyl-CoA thioester hydrolase